MLCEAGEAKARAKDWPEGPGSLPRMVRRMLMSRSAPQPRSRRTPRGGRMMARMILQISLYE